MKNLFLLPTDKPSRLSKYKEELLPLAKGFHYGSEHIVSQNIYITSDEEINENDYIITQDGRLVQVSYLLSKDLEGASKVIITTDQDLIKDGVQAIDDEFLEWFVKNPSCEKVGIEPLMAGFVDDEPSYYENMYDIIIPKEEIQPQQIWNEEKMEGVKKLIQEQETLEEVRKVERTELFNSIFSVVKQIPRKDVDGDAMDAPSCAYEIEQLFYKWQQEQDKKLYSEEEVLDILGTFLYTLQMGEDVEDVKLWFEQFKKK
jgi:lipoate-protein ligase A